MVASAALGLAVAPVGPAGGATSTGTIEGTVTAAADGTPLVGICVDAVQLGDTGNAGSTQTSAGGIYTISGLPAGNYTVEFSSGSACGGANYLTQWYNGQLSATTATPVPVSANGITSNIDAAMQIVGTITGTVTAAVGGSPLQGVCVVATETGNGPGYGFTQTLADGTYSITGLPTGSYTVKFYSSNGCTNASNLLPQWYDNQSSLSTATPVLVTAGSTTAQIDAAMAPAGAIQGTVTAAAGGADLAGICVTATGPGGAGGAATTAADGTYSIGELPAGSYTVAFAPGCGNTVSVLAQWYQGASTAAGATPVAVAAGSTASGIGAAMPPGGVISGTVTSAADGTSLPGICVSAGQSGGSGTASAQTDSSGHYTIMNLPTGTYTVEFTPACGATGNYADQWYDAKTSPVTATPVTVTAGSTTVGIDAAMEPGATIAGTVTAAGGGAIQGICVLASTQGIPPAVTATDSKGDYAISGLVAGTYTVEFSASCGASGYALQWYDNQSSSATATPVVLTTGQTRSGIDATMQPTGSISGTVTAVAGGQGLANVCVTATETGNGTGDGSLITLPGGAYTIGGLPAGTYTVDFQDCGNGTYAEQWYHGQSSAATANAVIVTAGQTTGHIDAAMSTQSLPGAPTNVAALAGNASAQVTWSAPASDGGSAITGYTVTAADTTTPANGHQTCTWSSGPLSCTVTGLTNGDSYTFTVTATNGVGTGPVSTPSSAVTPIGTPGKPTGVAATPGNAKATVTWSAPASDGGSPITGYTVTAADSTTPANGHQTCAWTSGPLTCTVTGLTNGDSYSFTVTATNAVGTGAASTASNPVIPATVPGAPTGVAATPGNAKATVTWSAPGSDGGSPITGYTVTAADSTTPANGHQTCAWTSGPLTCTVTGLTNGDSYSFTVTATNAVGTGPASTASNPVIPATVPGAPTGVAATPANASATVTWSAPASGGGSPITGYTVTAADSTTPANGHQTCAWTSGPLSCTVTGLTNGDSYTFTVTATNAVGTGPSSAASNAVTPDSVPGMPTNVVATAGVASAAVTWSAPVSDGGSPITGYTVIAADSTTPANGHQACNWTSGPLSCTVTGLTNGDSYTFTVTATNGVGTGPASAASSSVTPHAAVPGAPTGVTATRGNAKATVTWSAPGSDGGSPITGYTVTAADSTTPANGHQTCAWTSGPLSCTVTGLTNGDSYTFTVTATNAVGTGPASTASNAVIPATVPGAPTGVAATPANASATVTWSAPASGGGSPITGYTVTAADSTKSSRGGQTCSWTTGALSCTVTGLTNGDSYTFTVTAANGVGTGPASAASNPVTPATLPGAPTIGTATRGNASAVITWSAPASDGGSPIIGYTVTAADSTTPANGHQTCIWTGGALICTVTGLTNGDSYTFTVTATNAVGTGSSSAASNAVVPATAPGVPVSPTATGGNTSASITWSAPASDGGSPITGYTVTAADSTTPANGHQTCTWSSGPLTCTVSGLTNGDSYTFTVTATNAVGTGPTSAVSNTVTPMAVPGAPTGASATGSDTSASITWSAPASDGGSPIIGYTVTAADSTTPANGHQTCTWSSGPLTCTVSGLTNGDSYTFTVTATNAVGTGPASAASSPVTPMAVPGVPTSVGAAATNAAATVTWSAPASDGGSPITSYTVTAADSTTPANGHQTCTWSSGPLSCTVTGLTNGDSYTFTVTATNAVGTGPVSAASVAVTPAPILPGAPTIGSATPGNAKATVTWSAPASDGGSPITGYTVTAADSTTPANGHQTCTWSSGPLTCTVTGLTNGDSYTFTVTATNAVGTGPASAASNPVTPMTVPGAPTIGTATPGNTQATVTWSAPADDGGSAITGYTVTAADSTTPANGGQTCAWSSGPLTCTVTGLTNGDSYTFTVTATNAVGTGPASAASNPVTPMTVPGAPTIGTATPGNTQTTVTWSAPADDGGSAITGYTVTAADSTTPANGHQTCTWSSGPLSCTVTGLTNGDSYTFTVTATNAVGTGPASAASNPVTPMTVPGAPTIGTATPGNTQATVTWSAPADDGGSAITGYTVTAADSTTPANGGQTCAWSSGPLTCTVTGLTNGDSYTFTVTATNAVGTGPASAASNTVTTAPTAPGAPTIGTATPGNTQATVTWLAPADDGGSAITGYTVTSADSTTPANGGQTCAWSSGPLTCTVTGLTNGDSYTFTVTATNSVGTGPASAASNPVTPMTVPDSPTIGTATPGNTQATVTWTVPASDGGSPITGYTVTAADSTTPANGGQTCAWSSGPLTCTVTGLTNGDSYTFTVTAANSVGTGPASAASNPVTPAPTAPGAPGNASATGGANAKATVTWSAPADDGGSVITGYTVTAADSTTPANGGQTCTWSSGPLTCTVTGITNGDSYTFTVTATNSVGTGPASAASNPVTPATLPGAPTIGTAARGNAQATVTWSAPADDGGSVITGYTVTAADSTTPANGGQTCSWSSGPLTCTVTGLTNGDSYTFTVTATNSVGTGPASAASNPVTPATLPGAPTIGTAARGNAQTTVTWSAPADDGGSPVTGYTVTSADSTTPANGGQTCSWSSGPLTCTVTGLTNGDSYTFTVTATNSVGTGPASAASNPVTPATLPGAPTIGTATRGNTQATVTWSAPADDGGSVITGYTVTAADSTTPANGGQTCAWSSGPLTCTVTGLTNGDGYTFTVTAANSVGTGPASAASNAVTPAAVPGAPTIGTATRANASATVAWMAPADDGGSPVTGYTVTAADSTTPANGGQTCAWSSGPLTCTVTGLTNGDSYTFTVTATNSVGTGPASAASNPVTPATLPGAPRSPTATGANASAAVTWSAPASDGGSAINGYTVTAADLITPANGGETCTWSSGPLTCTVTGLTNGDAYVFTVTATNGIGTGPVSPASNAVTPMAVPGAPGNASATGADTSASVTWSAPADDGGSPITGYTVTAADSTTPANGGQTCAWSSGPLTCTVTGLTNGDSYTFTVTATNTVGTGPASAASNAVTPMTVPGAPGNATATGAGASATVTWSAPVSDGGSTVTGYTVTSADSTTPANGGQTCAWSSGPLTCTVTGLTNGDSYTFTVTATNSVGTGPASAASNAVTPMTVPGAPTIGTATSSNAQATVTWSAPADDGGSTITGYTVTAADSTTPANGGQTCAWSSGPLTCIVTGLTNGDSYTFTVTATNTVGTGPASGASSAVTPAPILPGAPTVGTATGADASATVPWSAPADDGGSAITGYTVTAADSTTPANGGQTCAWSSGPLSCTVTGLTNGDSYTFTVTATNTVGTGPASAASNAVTPMTVPGAPTIGTAIRGNAQATVTWSAPADDGGSTITGYTVTAADSTKASRGGETCTWSSGPLSCTVTGLTNGDSYTFAATATNSVGTGSASAASNPVVPATLPGAPTIGTATRGNAQVAVTWSAPASDGGSTITGYTVTAADSTKASRGGETCTWSSGPLSCTVTGLTNGDSYTFTVTATNAVGTGPASDASHAVTPATVPGAPTIGTATRGNTQVVVTWSAPASDGGSPVTGYTVTAADSTTPANGGQTCAWSSGPLTCTVTGLTNGDSYTFTVTATNAVGTGPTSAASNPVTPAAVPGAPTIGTATRANASATVTWSAPADDGGSPVTGYTVTAADSTTPANGGQTCAWSSGPLTCTVTGLTNGDRYTFTVTATNGAGSGLPSTSSNAVAPATVPGPPTLLPATAGVDSVSLAWSAPPSDGGSAITAYDLFAGPSAESISSTPMASIPATQSSYTVNGLTGGQPYFFVVRAQNAIGRGEPSNMESATPTVPHQAVLASNVVGMAATPDGGGYWLTDSSGSVSTHGDAAYFGSMAGTALNAPISHIVASPDGNGYWLVASDGGTFAFGDAGFFGSMGGKALNAPVVDIAPTQDGRGYWLVASDGGIFAFGDASFHGSMGGVPLNRPVVGISADYATGGYWLVASDGGIFAFGAPFYGSTGSLHLNDPVNGMAASPDDGGYLFVASDGGIFAFGDAVFHGSMGGAPLAAPIVGMAVDRSTSGYWLVGADGGIFAFGAPSYGPH